MTKRNNKRNNSKSGKSNNRSNSSANFRSTNNYPDTVDTANRAKKNTSYDSIRSNDISWYNKSVTYSDAVRVPFNRIIGDPIEVGGMSPKTDYGATRHYLYSHVAPTPGIMRIEYAPTIGISRDVNSQVNRCFTSIYGDIYSKTTGAMQFQQADLALLSLGLSSIMANIAMAKRALGISLLFSNENYYYPKAIMRAIGIDPESVIGRQDSIRMRLNELISNVNHLKMPAFIDLFKRAYQLPLNIYADEDDIKSQLFAFVPEGYYIYQDVPDVDSDYSHLKYKQFEFTQTGLCMTMDALLDVINQQLEAWRQSSDLGIISGSIQRAYDDSQLIMLDWVSSDYLTVPVHDKVMNWQINNAVLVGKVEPTSMYVTQDPVTNSLIHQPRIKYASSGLASSRDRFILNSYDGTTDDVFIMEATRLMVHSDANATTETNIIDVCGTEIPTRGLLYHLVRDGEQELIREAGYQYCSLQVVTLDGLNTVAEIDSTLSVITMVSRFRNAPRLETLIRDSNGEQYTTLPVGDLYRYTLIDVDSLRGLMVAAYQSIYVPNERTNIK